MCLDTAERFDSWLLPPVQDELEPSGEVLVREPLMVQPTVPRFLVEGDEFEVPVFVTNTTKKPAEVQVTLESDYLLGPDTAGAPAGSPIALRAVVDTLSLKPGESGPVSYTHLTLPTICSV